MRNVLLFEQKDQRKVCVYTNSSQLHSCLGKPTVPQLEYRKGMAIGRINKTDGRIMRGNEGKVMHV
jgi:hypothetical protein